MRLITRRRLSASLLLLASAVAVPRLAAAESERQQTAASGAATSGSVDLTQWLKVYDPRELGTNVAQHFVPSPHFHPDRIVYPEVCAWYGALELARVTNNTDLIGKLQARFEPLFGAEAALLPPVGQHVDYSMFGSLPLEFYMITKDKKYLDLGLRYADAQWAKPDAQGLTDETRFWVDDMYMVTIVQVQAFRATGDHKHLDRAATQMAAYLDKLKQPNGLFFHAPDVPFFWGRGNGWFAVGMTELLRDLPRDHAKRVRIEQGYQTMMAALLRYQPPPERGVS